MSLTQNQSGTWNKHIVYFFCAILAIAILFWGGISSAFHLWIGRSSYNHCLLIFPLALYLAWENRANLDGIEPRASAWGLAVVLAFAVIWLMADLSGINEGTHFAIVGMIQGALLALFGGRVYRTLLLPFSYLWLMVPTGEFLLPTLQMVTARGAARLLAAVGVPAFLDGVVIEVPSGVYQVAPGCAGLNYLLAALAISMAYGELIFRGTGRRLTMIGTMLALAVAGNILRVFLIILIGHLTDNQADIVDDHIVYGWGFFSALVLLFMWVAARFRDDVSARTPRTRTPPHRGRPVLGAATAALGVIAIAATAPAALAALGTANSSAAPEAPRLTCGPFAEVPASPGWAPRLAYADSSAMLSCGINNQHVDLYVALLNRPVREGKLIGADWRLGGLESWSVSERGRTTTQLAGQQVVAASTTLTARGRTRVAWTLFWVDGQFRRPGLRTAAADLAGELTGHGRRAAMVTVSAEGADAEDASAALRTFLDGQENLEVSIKSAHRRPNG